MPVSQSYPQARLAEHVRACRIGDQIIFLDLREGKYIGVGGAQVPALCSAIFGPWAADDRQDTPRGADLPAECLRRLRQQRLLSDAPAAETARTLPELPEPTASLTVDECAGDVDFDWRHLVRLWRATFVTAAWLRRYSLADIATRVAALRSRHSEAGEPLAVDATRVAVEVYTRLRPFALTAHDRCLNDSLALIHFLATQGLFARWVIGARVHPFGAHSWVQSGGVVLNDLPERVRHYQPILVV
jgi:Transglutaminase-like superfamily